ncbi:hypothetical protein [Hymenobacter elongatus]|uniref:Glycosyltransferase RgtA/B/C/D-like domain-containing protein n=1 Tax=Hymenobacter elongatus TaxID=877208 RepID=A0A4Z0PKE7_9BACT|nr:hypothetical protein [Hymenobacter elongatus]TGE15651.1 hypothetical protein E5J99_11745 [Hymenobacter elongatus]
MINTDTHYPNQPARWWQSRNNWLWFLLTSLLFLGHLLTTRYKELYGDSWFYWHLANSFDQEGASQFSIYNFDSALRGYLLPLLYYPAVQLVRNVLPENLEQVVKVLGALWAGALFGVVCPLLWQKVTGMAVSSLRRLLFVGVCFMLWRDYFNFVLSDFPSMLALALALLLAYRVQSLWAAAAVGALVAAAVYVRPLNLLTAPFLVALMVQQVRVYQAGKGGFIVPASMRVALFALAFLLVGIPQYLINVNNYQEKTFLVLAKGANERKLNETDNLYLFKLNEGLVNQRYETNVGANYPQPQAVFIDLAGRAMVAQINWHQFESYPEYFFYVLRHPFDILGVYMRHLFNGLDVLYAGPYVHNLYGSTMLNSFVVYTVLFLALVVIVVRIHLVRFSHWLVIGALVITCLASMPLMVECRFFIPLHLLLYAVACYGWPADWGWKQATTQKRLALVAAYSLFFLLCLAISSNTQAMLEKKPKTIQAS